MNYLIFTLGLLLGSFITFAVAYWLQKRYERKLKQTVDQMPRRSYDPNLPLDASIAALGVTAADLQKPNPAAMTHTIYDLQHASMGKSLYKKPPTEKPFNE